MTTHELWFHDCLGWFAVRLDEGQVSGICGPIPDATALDCDPSTFFYDDRPEAIQRAKESPEQFVPLEAWARGGLRHPARHPLVEFVVSVLGDLWSRLVRLLGL